MYCHLPLHCCSKLKTLIIYPLNYILTIRSITKMLKIQNQQKEYFISKHCFKNRVIPSMKNKKPKNARRYYSRKIITFYFAHKNIIQLANAFDFTTKKTKKSKRTYKSSKTRRGLDRISIKSLWDILCTAYCYIMYVKYSGLQ